MSKSNEAGPVTRHDGSRVALGVLCAASGAVGFGFLPLFLHWSYTSGLAPEAALLWRFGGGLVLMLPALVLGSRAWRHGGVAFFAGLSVGLATVSLFHSYASLPVTLVILIFYTYPAFTLIFARLFTGAPVTPRLVAAVAAVLLAALLIVRPDAEAGVTWSALLLAFLGPAGFAGYLTLASQVKPETHITARINAVNLGALVVALPLALSVLDAVIPADTKGWIGVLYLAVITGIVSNALSLLGASLAGGVRAAIAGSAELVTALCIGVFLFNESLTWSHLIGAALLLAAIGLTLPARRQSNTQP